MYQIFISLIVASTLWLVSCQTNQNHLSEKEFTQRYKDSLMQREPDANYEIQEDLKIKVSEGKHDMTIYLDNAYRAYTLQPDSLASIFSDYLNSSISSLTKTELINKNSIVPVIKPFKYIEDVKSLDHGNTSLDSLIYYEPYNDELIIVYAEDTELNIRYLQKHIIDSLNIGLDTLRDFAFNNLRKILPDVEIINSGGKFGILAGGVYEASLILSKTMWNKENFSVDGNIVIAMPTRDMVYVTGSKNKQEINKLKSLALKDFENENYQVSPFLFRYNGTAFERFRD
ncbi:DUF1444 family protein [Sphingobacterium olei]|uniref:DUF1444 family protein n=1 Tax=Sphingobacterium olei TaxID=2571155 RepID=A0A4U0P2L1_9SPHI|nr:DUF1444 family protein [Sphingobacterium olei]TJZ61537.1 DUF1444 family protein [Sphingobacterium olei]